jgi:hypothetical protein
MFPGKWLIFRRIISFFRESALFPGKMTVIPDRNPGISRETDHFPGEWNHFQVKNPSVSVRKIAV